MEIIGIVIIQLLKIKPLLFLPLRCHSNNIIILIIIFISKLEECCGNNWNCHHSVIENRAFIFFLFSRDSNFLINGFKENSKIKFRGSKKKKKIWCSVIESLLFLSPRCRLNDIIIILIIIFSKYVKNIISKLKEYCGNNWNCHHSVIEKRAVTTSLPFK